jgi:hypothetical protein
VVYTVKALTFVRERKSYWITYSNYIIQILNVCIDKPFCDIVCFIIKTHDKFDFNTSVIFARL